MNTGNGSSIFGGFDLKSEFIAHSLTKQCFVTMRFFSVDPHSDASIASDILGISPVIKEVFT